MSGEDQKKVYNPEEELAIGDWKLVDVPKANIEKIEDKEENLFEARTKIYRWRDDEWKERGIGNVNVYKNKETKKIRALHCDDKTFKVRAHFYIHGEKLCELKPLKSSKNTLFWSCIDFSEGKAKLEQFAIRFKTPEQFEKFKTIWEESYKANSQCNWSCSKSDKKEEKKEETKEEPKKKEETKKSEKKEEGEIKETSK